MPENARSDRSPSVGPSPAKKDLGEQDQEALDYDHGTTVPQGQLARFARFTGMAAGLAGNVVADGGRELLSGNLTSLQDLLLTPKNAARVADDLARMRGAAMKVGQLMSMDGGEFIPPELADILARLRSQGTPMPAHQLKALLNNEWGHGWRRKFKRFEPMPIAAASIGQVHRAMLKDGRQLAIKVQYPGVRESINSDVDNIRTLINLSGLLPKGVSLDQFLEEAKKQLHQEADYDAEGERLTAFREALSTYPDYLVPELVEDITTKSVLSMTYVGGDPVEMLSDADQATRDRVMTLLIRLLYKELFDFNLMQTDPNFANFRFDRATNKLVLLDFGATREIPNDLAAGYKKLMTAALTGDKDTLRQTSISMGLITATLFEENEDLFFELFDLASEAFRYDTEYDFAGSNLSTRMRDAAVRVDIRRMMGHTPPIDTAFIHRKFGGIFLLGVRLKAKVNVRRLFEPYVQ